MRRAYAEIQALGAEVLTVSPDTVPALREYKAKTGTLFPMLSDENSAVIRQYQIENRFELRHRGVPHPATYVIARGGRVVLEDVRRNYLWRIPMSPILDALRKPAE